MKVKKASAVRCLVCNPTDAGPGEYCDKHGEELHHLEHKYETLFRLRRNVRGKDHETYDLFLQGKCDPTGRILVSETDPGGLAITVLIIGDLDLATPMSEYAKLGIERTYADHLRDRIHQDVVLSWYGNARACVEVFRATGSPLHWDLESREEQSEEETSDLHLSPGGRHTVH